MPPPYLPETDTNGSGGGGAGVAAAAAMVSLCNASSFRFMFDFHASRSYPMEAPVASGSLWDIDSEGLLAPFSSDGV